MGAHQTQLLCERSQISSQQIPLLLQYGKLDVRRSLGWRRWWSQVGGVDRGEKVVARVDPADESRKVDGSA